MEPGNNRNQTFAENFTVPRIQNSSTCMRRNLSAKGKETEIILQLSTEKWSCIGGNLYRCMKWNNKDEVASMTAGSAK